MPNRHSNNNTAKSYFTHAEKHRLQYGSHSARLGRDSIKVYDYCSLCLQKARSPMLWYVVLFELRRCILRVTNGTQW